MDKSARCPYCGRPGVTRTASVRWYEGDPNLPPVTRGALVRQTDSYECDQCAHQWDEDTSFGGPVRMPAAAASQPGPLRPMAPV
jgi:hypothetical protein